MTVEVVVNKKGKIEKHEFKDGDVAFRRTVTKAMKSWRFEPLVMDGRKVKSKGILKFNFKLE